MNNLCFIKQENMNVTPLRNRIIGLQVAVMMMSMVSAGTGDFSVSAYIYTQDVDATVSDWHIVQGSSVLPADETFATHAQNGVLKYAISFHGKKNWGKVSLPEDFSPDSKSTIDLNYHASTRTVDILADGVILGVSKCLEGKLPKNWIASAGKNTGLVLEASYNSEPVSSVATQ